MTTAAARHLAQTDAAVLRAIPPEWMRAEDVAAVWGIGVAAARRCMARGEAGPPIKRGRRWYVHREDFADAMRARTVRVATDPGEPGEPPAWAARLLEPRRGAGRVGRPSPTSLAALAPPTREA